MIIHFVLMLVTYGIALAFCCEIDGKEQRVCSAYCIETVRGKPLQQRENLEV